MSNPITGKLPAGTTGTSMLAPTTFSPFPTTWGGEGGEREREVAEGEGQRVAKLHFTRP